MDRPAAWKRLLPWAIGALVAVVYALWVRAWWFLGDDAFIGFRYAKHLAEGFGPVWNPGERVEGYTSFLWVVLMAGVHAAGGSPELVANVAGVACGAALLVLVARFAAQRAPAGFADPLVFTAPLALAASRSFTAWSTGGLETMAFALLVFATFVRLARERASPGLAPWGSGTLAGLAALTRPEGLLFAAVAGAFHGLDALAGRRRWRALFAFALPLVLLAGTHLVWRRAYYGFWLPNTFYAKVAGAWWEQGWRYLSLFAADYRILPFLPLGLLPLARRGDRAMAPLAVAVGAFLAYLLYVGGDRFEFRFLVFVLPLGFALIAEGLRDLARLEVGGPAARRVRDLLAVAGALGLVAASQDTTLHPPHERLRHGIASLSLIDDYARQRTGEGRFLRDLVERGLLPGDIVLAVGGAGALPYYTGWPTVDRLGINDVYVAHLPLARRGIVGHEREAPYAYLRERGVELLDVHNRIVHDTLPAERLPARVSYDGHWIDHHVFRVDGRYLVFASFVDDERLAQRLGRLERIRRGG